MGQSIYFDFDFNKFIDSISSMDKIPKYHKNYTRISKSELLEPLRLLSTFIPEKIRDFFKENQINIILTPSFRKKISCDSNKKSISINDFTFKEEYKRTIAYFIGTLFSKFVSRPVTTDANVSGEEQVKDKRPFSLESEYVDYELFFGYLFEFIYLVEKQKEIELKRIGLVENTPNVVDNAFDEFVLKYLNKFKKEGLSYSVRKLNFKTRLARGGNETPDYYYQDGSNELQEFGDTYIDSRFRSKIASFNKVLEFIKMDFSSNEYINFFKSCLIKKDNVIIPKDINDDSYRDLLVAYQGYNESSKNLLMNF